MLKFIFVLRIYIYWNDIYIMGSIVIGVYNVIKVKVIFEFGIK